MPAHHYDLAGFDVEVTKEGNKYVAKVTCGTHHWHGKGDTAGDAIDHLLPKDPPKTECKLCTNIRRSKSVTAALARG